MVQIKRKKVMVGMSAGVDSTVAAALLQKQGYEVVGVFMHFWQEESLDKARENKCCSLESYQELKKICQQLEIKLVVANVEKEFKKEIVDYFLREYKNGRTPNPCVACNKEIKFKVLLKKMLELKADYVATGHYARIKKIQDTRNLPRTRIEASKKQKIYKLFEAKDKEKDQTYFLYNLNQKQLAKILFPIGEYQKSQVRKMAKKFKLAVHDKKESQDICFINSSVANFLTKYLKLRKGKIINQARKIVGEHQGLPLYTLGQRKGINIGGDGPYYVAGKDFAKNRLLVTNQKEAEILFKKEMELEDVNWIGEIPKFPTKILARTRYRNPLFSAIIKSYGMRHRTCKIVFNQAQKNITPGQSAVFYAKNGELLGGGVIK